MTRSTSSSLCAIALLLAAGAASAETRHAPFTSDELHEQATLVFEGVVLETDTVEAYTFTFPVRARVERVVKGRRPGGEISFRPGHPGLIAVFAEEFHAPAPGRKGTFYIQDRAGVPVLIGYLSEDEPAPAAGPGALEGLHEITLQYRIWTDAVAPSRFVVLEDGGISPYVTIHWKIPETQKAELDALIERLEAEGPNGMEFRARGRRVSASVLEVHEIEPGF